MQPEKTIYQQHDNLALATYLEECVISFFSMAAEVELVAPPPGQQQPLTGQSITSIVNFEGLEQGFLALNISESLARHLMTRMLGDVEELSDRCMLNSLGEAVNILTLSLLEGLPEKHCHRLSLPAMIRDDDTLLQKLLQDNRGYTCSFFHGTERIVVKFVIHPADCMMTSFKPDDQTESALRQAHRLFSCPRFGHPCRREQLLETSSPHTVHGLPQIIRPDFQVGMRFDPAP